MPASERAIELALAAAQAAADKKANDIVIIDVADQLVITDAFLVASAPNERQVQAIVDAIEERLLELPEKAKPVRREGERGTARSDAQHVHFAPSACIPAAPRSERGSDSHRENAATCRSIISSQRTSSWRRTCMLSCAIPCNASMS